MRFVPVLIIALSSSPSVLADETNAVAAHERALALEQQALQMSSPAREAKLAESCALREVSDRESPTFRRKWMLGKCYELMGKTATAWIRYKAALQYAQVQLELHPNEELVTQARNAQEKVDEIAKRVPLLRVVVELKVPGLTIRQDDSIIAESLWGELIPLDAGVYTVVARAPGHREYSKKATLIDGEPTVIEIPPLPVDTTQPPDCGSNGACEASVTPALQSTPLHASSNVSGPPLGTWVLAGVGLASVGAAGIFSLIGNSDWSSAQSQCKMSISTCTSQGLSLERQATAMGNLSTAFVIAGGVAFLAGVTVWLVSPFANSTTKTGISLTPAGISLVGRF